ncbi:MAG: TlpA disulfide reductase family protein [Acidobacteriota bacterium]
MSAGEQAHAAPAPAAASASSSSKGRGRTRKILKGLRHWLLFFALAFLSATAVGRWRAPSLPEAAPAFTLKTLEGQPVSLADFKGRTVVLNFWATWCPPCRVELPSFIRFARKNPDVAVLGLSVQSPPEDLRAAIEEKAIPYPVLIVDGAVAEAYGVTSLPTTVVIDSEGRVRSAHAGMLFGPQLWWMTR